MVCIDVGNNCSNGTISRKDGTMRRIRYSLAASLDGFIAGPKGESDSIIMDPAIDFEAMYKQFDTVLMGRRSFEAAGGRAWGFGMETVVVSRTLRQQDHPDITIVGHKVKQALTALRREPGKDIWLFGGGALFGSLLDMSLVDAVEVALVPVLLGHGIPLLPPPFRRSRLTLTSHKIYKTGIVGLEYNVRPAPRPSTKRKTKRAHGKKSRR
jgi:dihydrofolate reductase